MKQLIPLVIICLSFIVNQPLLASKDHYQGEKSMNITKPIVSLSFSFAGCDYIPKVNGVDFKHSLGASGVVKSSMTINQWLKPGKNTITLILKPGDDADKLVQGGQACDAKLTLQVKPADEKDNYHSIMTYHFHSKANNITPNESHLKDTTEAGQLDSSQDFKRVEGNGDIKIGPMHIKQIDTEYGPGVKMTREVDMPLPFPKWAWFDGDEIPNTENTKKELIKQYERVWNAINRGNLDTIKDLFNTRNQELAQAFYKPVSDFHPIKSIKENIHDPNMKLGGPFKPQYTHVVRTGNGKLAALMINNGDGGCIFFNNNKYDTSTTYDMWFMKKDGEWKVIR